MLPFVAALATAATPARAQPSDAKAYAVVVGSNPGGAGQETLRYAERDAENVATLLRELGGYGDREVTLLRQPSPRALLAAIDRVGAALLADRRAGRQTVLFFYYSGHARSRALNLGADELALDRLRETIMALPATLKIVVLDACQSGAFSGVKGAEPAADFSYNSVSRLQSAGVAVMASSSASELSQESERLGGSYFTHYLLVAMRGAGDGNRDGRVSLDEAYDYAYARTLEATAKTAVGRQHVTLETDLRGKGDVPLTYPARANAHLALPNDLRAEVLIQTRSTGAVVAEVHKVPGPVKLALRNGQYKVLVVRGREARQCNVALPPGRTVVLAHEGCARVTLSDGTSKGGALRHRWSVELGIGGSLGLIEDRYVDRLGDFGYRSDFRVPVHYTLSGVYLLSRNLAVVGNLAALDTGLYRRDDDTEVSTFEWRSHGATLLLRGEYPLGYGGILVPFAEAGGGVAWARNKLQVGERPATTESDLGYQLLAAAGARLQKWDHVGLFLRLAYAHAPTMDNLLGDTHDSGGAFLSLGMTGRF
jgi:uncharacterized caspase-like protein